MKIRRRLVRLNTNTVILLLVALVVGGGIYFRLLWFPLGGWIFEYIAAPVMEFVFPDNMNILTGLICMALAIPFYIFIYVLFFLPYLALWVVIYIRFLSVKVT